MPDTPKPQPLVDAAHTARAVELTNEIAGDAGGAVGAYEQLRLEYDKYTRAHTPEENKAYWTEVTSQLAKDAVLPDLTVAWLKENDSYYDGKKAPEIQATFRYDLGPGADPQYAFDRAFAVTQPDQKGKSLAEVIGDLDNYGQTGFPHIDRILNLHTNDFTVHADELDGYLQKQAVDNQTNSDQRAAADKNTQDALTAAIKSGADEQSARKDQAQLFAGTPPLISVIDGGLGGQKDGVITADEMRQFVDHCQVLQQYGGKLPDNSPFTKDNAAYVNSILNGEKPGIVLEKLPAPNSGTGLTAAGLAAAGGYEVKAVGSAEDYTALAKNFAAASETDSKPAVVRAGDQVASITYINGARKDEFTYDPKDPSKLTKVVERIGTAEKVTYQNDGTGRWGPVNADGSVATDLQSPTDFTVTKDGRFTYKNADGQDITVTDQGMPVGGTPADSNSTVQGAAPDVIQAPAPNSHADIKEVNPQSKAAPPETSTASVPQPILDAATHKGNEGPWQAASRLLGTGAQDADINALSSLLKQNWQDTHGDPGHKNDKMTGLEPNYQWVNPANLQELLDKSPAFKARYDAIKAQSDQPVDPGASKPGN